MPPILNVASSFLGGVANPFRANGGPVSAGGSFIVGEKGPEIFTPRTSGMITANDKIGGTQNNFVTVNVEAGGTTTSGNDVDLNKLGEIIGVVVQAQLVKERQAGGILAR